MCDYKGYEFGAGSYPDSICVDGRLFDADNCDDAGNLHEPTEDIPCPMCHEAEAIAYWKDRFECGGESAEDAETSAKSLVADIRRNREHGSEPWKQGTSARQITLRHLAMCSIGSECLPLGTGKEGLSEK